MARMAYEVQTDVFEGPFDLLLHLILREQVELYDISLAAIVDAYLAELDRMDHFDLEIATEFLLIAATLVELKTKRMLPGDDDLDLEVTAHRRPRPASVFTGRIEQAVPDGVRAHT
jgi:segregation and condensation protein A